MVSSLTRRTIVKNILVDKWTYFTVTRHNSTQIDIYINGTLYAKNIEMEDLYYDISSMEIGVSSSIRNEKLSFL